MMLKIFIVYFAIGLFLTIKVGRDDFVRWVDNSNCDCIRDRYGNCRNLQKRLKHRRSWLNG